MTHKIIGWIIAGVVGTGVIAGGTGYLAATGRISAPFTMMGYRQNLSSITATPYSGYGMMGNGSYGTGSGMMGNGSYGTGSGMMGNGSYGTGSGMMGGNYPGATTSSKPVTGVSAMNIQNFAFQFPVIQIKVGTTITWTNKDTTPHTVTFTNGMKNSGNMVQGATFSYTFTTPGTYTYVCAYHPQMTGEVIVTQ